MAKTISVARPSDPIRAVAQMMKREDTGFIPVVDGDRLLGVITDRDIVMRCIAEGHDVLQETAEHCMSTSARTVEVDADIEMAGHIMGEHEIRRLCVVENGRLVGILSHGNLVQATHSDGPADEATLGVTRGA
jgi:CBS domain-containing protein